MVTIKKLNCGTTVIMEKSERVQSAALGIWVRAGASDEWDEVSGVSHFIEHMMFKGTKNRTAKQIAEDVDKIGGVFNAFTGKEATCYYIKTLSSNICKGAEILLDMLTGSKFDQEEMDRERQVICEEIKMVKDTPDDDVYDTISELVAGGNPLGRSILGTPESLAGIDRSRLVDYRDQMYARDSIVVAVAGNFDEEAIEAIFEDRLTSLRDKKPELGKAILVPAVSFVVLSIFRYLYNAPRPYEVFDTPSLIRKDTRGKSFPSRHVFSAFVIAVTVFYTCHPLGIFLGICSLLLAVSRVLGGVHFTKDVLAGAVSGILCGMLLFIL